jgi:hypothetical protein
MRSRPPWNRRALAVHSLALGGALAALGGCAQLLGIDDLSGARDAAPPPDEFSTDIDADVDTTCSDGVVPGGGTGTTPIDTEAAGNDFTASCGGESSPDQMLLWTAPITDYYVFDTFGSSFDTVLGLYAECAGEEFACSNNVGELGQSEVVRKFEGGQRALVLVDGAAGDSGQGALNIERVTCPDADVEGLVFPVELSTLGFGNDFAFPCGGIDHEDRAYHWVAPADGLYYFRATSDTFTPALTLLDGPRCSDRVLGCGGAFFGPYGAEVVRYLSARQAVSVVVDGVNGAGLFTLDIGLTPDQSCSEAVIMAAGEPIVDDFTERTLAPSCAFARQSDSDMQLYEAPDKVYTLVVPAVPPECFGECGVTVTSPQEIVLYGVETEQCGGAEVGCQLALFDGTGANTTASIAFPRAAEETRHTVVVADRSELDGGGGFRVETFCSLACP